MLEELEKVEQNLLQISAVLTMIRLNPDPGLFLERERLTQLAEDLIDRTAYTVTKLMGAVHTDSALHHNRKA